MRLPDGRTYLSCSTGDWVSVRTCLPPQKADGDFDGRRVIYSYSEHVVLFYPETEHYCATVAIGYYRYDSCREWACSYEPPDRQPSHWMPLPEPPLPERPIPPDWKLPFFEI